MVKLTTSDDSATDGRLGLSVLNDEFNNAEKSIAFDDETPAPHEIIFPPCNRLETIRVVALAISLGKVSAAVICI